MARKKEEELMTDLEELEEKSWKMKKKVGEEKVFISRFSTQTTSTAAHWISLDKIYPTKG
jgi:hypothetical protein